MDPLFALPQSVEACDLDICSEVRCYCDPQVVHTQRVVALASGEAEVYASSSVACHAMLAFHHLFSGFM